MRMRRDHRERGTTTLEMAALVPLALVIMFVFIQAAFVLYSVTATQTAARQGARAASLDQNPVTAVDRALPSWIGHEVSQFGPGNGVSVRSRVPQIVPGMDFTIERTAVMP